MELLPLGPVVIIDTPGMDDEGELGEMRVKRARQILGQADIAVLVADVSREPMGELLPQERELTELFEEKKLPYLIAWNKADLLAQRQRGAALHPEKPGAAPQLAVSAKTGENLQELKEQLGGFARQWESRRRHLVSDLLAPGDLAVLVIPIDESAPKGRLILPQQQTMRDILDAHGRFLTCQPEELRETLNGLAVRPKLVITDSQAFARVASDVPEEIRLTSFSILFARYKGNLTELVRGAAVLGRLSDGDRVLISEGCTHHRQCNDIGTVKLPGWIRQFSGAKPVFDFTSGGTFPEDLSAYRLIVHCGGCMLNEAEMNRRQERARAAGIPMVNYGIAIAHMHGILRRSLAPFPEAQAALTEP